MYQFVLLIVLVGMLIGVGVIALDKFGGASGIGTQASTAINQSRTEVGNIATQWLGLIVTIGVLAVIITLVIRSFGFGQSSR